jgi:hypothetical protein
MQRHFSLSICLVTLAGAAARAECPAQWLTGPEFGMPGVNGRNGRQVHRALGRRELVSR